MIFDTHCHYNLEPLYSLSKILGEGWDPTHWQKAQAHDVTHAVVVGTNLATSVTAIDISQTDEHLFAAIGVHPTEYQELWERYSATNPDPTLLIEQDIQAQHQELQDMIHQNPVVAIGETGLDYFHLKQATGLSSEAQQKITQLQHSAFRMQIKVAQSHSLPLIIHVRDTNEEAYWDVLRILKDENYQGKWILHCVSGPLAYVQEAVTQGAYFGVAGNSTYKNAEHIRDLVRSVPHSQILLETDAPYLPPIPFRGQVCEPWMIANTAEYLQKELNVSLEKVFENSLRAFSLPNSSTLNSV